MEIFIGGGGDDLAFLGLGVVADYARARAAATGRLNLYLPNGRLGRVRRAIAEAAARDDAITLIGHSWGGPDAWRAAVWAAREDHKISALVTLDPVGGPIRRSFNGALGCPWLDVVAAPALADRSDRLTRLSGLSRKPSGLPTQLADRQVLLNLNHWNVAGMLAGSDAWRWVQDLGA